jgi:prepilin-type N-terminal cleavage/methylation domain-containing protein
MKIFMRHDEKTESRREQPVAVDWHDCAWSPSINVQTPPRPVTKPLPAPQLVPHTPRRNPIYFKTMKTILPSSRRHRAGFTLVELLVVIAIIGILASMLVVVLGAAKKHAQRVQARLNESDIVTAIEGYDSAYSRLPVSSAAQSAAGTGDYTYGAIFQNAAGGTTGLLNPTYPMTNSEVIAILMDATNYPNGTGATVDIGHVKNPQQTKFLNAVMSGWDPSQGGPPVTGVGNDLVYRDPWGNPYVISMDLNYDGLCEDAFYGMSIQSSTTGNLTQQPDGNYAFHGKVMVWSAGPDGKIDPAVNAITGANKDNVVSWQ